MNIQKGAEIIIRDWVRLRGRERLLIVSSRRYETEMQALLAAARQVSRHVELLVLDELSMYVGTYFNEREDAFDAYDAIIGASEYSLITTKAVKRAISRRKRFLSLPLSTNDGNSMLSYEFLRVDTAKSKIMAAAMLDYYQSASRIDIKTSLGTDLHLNIKGRRAGFFNGCCKDGRGLSSASVEVYVSIVKTTLKARLCSTARWGISAWSTARWKSPCTTAGLRRLNIIKAERNLRNISGVLRIRGCTMPLNLASG